MHDETEDEVRERQRRQDVLGELARRRLDTAMPAPTPSASMVSAPASKSQRRRSPRRSAVARLIGWTVALALFAGLAYAARDLPAFLAGQRGGTPTASGACHGSAASGAAENVQVSHDNFPAHSEPMLAENPADPRNLVGGSKFFTDPAHYRFKIGTYASFDGGCTWVDGGVLPGFQDQAITSDISLAFGTHNDVYAAVLTVDPAGRWGIAVSASPDGGKTFHPPVTVYFDAAGQVFSDKPWIAVDRTNGPHRGTIYVVWSHDVGSCGDDNGCSQALAFSRSTDGGQTFSPVAQVEGSAPFCTNPATGRPGGSTRCDAVLGTTPVVLPDGTLAVGFAYMDVMSTGKIPTRMAVTTSRDGGQTWGIPVLVATIADIYGRFPPDRYRNVSLPAFACDPKTGQLYLAWADKATGDADILLSTSTDQGQTWSAPKRVNDDPPQNRANQFQPQLAVAPNGVVSVAFFDTRADPAHRRIDVYLAQSTDHGASFRPNIRVTDVSFDPAAGAPVDRAGNQFIGDYQGLAAADDVAHPFWNDSRTGQQEIFTAAVLSAQP